jgi:uncharacterized protein (TIGR04255 family)
MLPQYDSPPVNETVLGIEFKPLNAWGLPHFGLFWTKIREKYPKFSVQPPLPEESSGGGFRLSFGPMPQVRCWFHDDKDHWLIQVQNSRFISNWRKRDDSPYPSYTLFRDRFVEQYMLFQSFLAEEELGETAFFQAEVSYINLIDIEGDFRRLPEIFPVFSEFKEGTCLPLPQGGGTNFVYPMPDEKGRLHVGIQSVLNHEAVKEVVQLSVTGKTLIASNDLDSALASLDNSHEWVVRGFTDFTTPAMHEAWGRTK